PPCLEALAAQTHAIDELLVVDNASTDASEAIVRARAPRAAWVSMGTNEGPCPARNAALERARNEWVLLVDNDAVLEPDVLEKLVAAVRAHPAAVLVQPRSVFADDPGVVHYDGGRFHYAGLFSLRNFSVPIAQAEGRGTLEVDGAVSVALLARRSVLLELGGFDADYFILFEDLDLSYRVRLAGHAILSVEDALVLHRGGTGGISFRGAILYPRRRAFFHSRNRWIYLAKCYALRTLLVAAPGLLVYELVWLAFTLRSGTFGGWLEGKRDFLAKFSGVRARRRTIQSGRRRRDRDLLVGGPLTLSAQLRGGAAERLLDGTLRAWWALVRRLAG
ncbi:MAG TPA: glycosyltransferase family 2 protein, partial [Planctomycetota bacterium]|nr:glycosyltransferase family 2 protein [Planctomycetota bacterium]